MKHTGDGIAFKFGDWQVQPGLNRIVRGSRVVELPPRSMAVLHYLLQRYPDVVSLDELLAHVWHEQVVELGSVQRHIARLRRAFDDDPKAPAYIETIHKHGYRAIAECRASSPPPSPDTSIAVLPFDNLSPDPENAYFAAGIHEELLTRLAQVKALHVISRTSVLEYAGHPTSVRAIGQALGVAHIVEGSVRRADDTVRISVQLIDARTDNHLWAENYERALTTRNVFAIQGEIATSIVQQLCGALSAGDVTVQDAPPTDNTQAYDCYLSGNDFFRLPDAEQLLPSALHNYEQAVSLDPDFALAHAALSHVHSRYYWVGLDRTSARLQLAKAAFERAFDLAPGLAEAHLAAGQYYYRAFDNYARALDEYTLAEAKLGGTSDLAMARAEVYRRMGRWDESLTCWQQAMELDPRNAVPVFQYANTALFCRDYATAERYGHLGRALQPSQGYYLINVELVRDGSTASMSKAEWLSWLVALYARDYAAQLGYLHALQPDTFSSMFTYVSKASLYGLAYQLLNQPESARSWYQQAHDAVYAAHGANPADPLLCIALGEALAGLGEPAAANKLAEQALVLRPTAQDAMIGPAIQLDAVMRIFLSTGAHDRALAELQRYLASPGIWSIEGLLPDPRLDPVRELPEFIALVQRFKRG